MNSTEPRTGYELAAKILAAHPDDAIETMLRCSHGTESDWLEFKAGMTLLPEDIQKGLKPDDLYWKYAESIAAMSNTFGGAFVIGVDNKHNPVPLSSCDPRKVLENGDTDDYIRNEILRRIAPAEPNPQSWTDFKGVSWSIENARLAPVVEPRLVPFHGEKIVVLLVKPTKLGEEFIVVRTLYLFAIPRKTSMPPTSFVNTWRQKASRAGSLRMTFPEDTDGPTPSTTQSIRRQRFLSLFPDIRSIPNGSKPKSRGRSTPRRGSFPFESTILRWTKAQ